MSLRYFNLLLLIALAPNVATSASISVESSAENWGVVEPGLVYRSKKLTPSNLETRLQKFGIRSILCFDKCSDLEKRQARKAGVEYFDQTVKITELELSDAVRMVETLERAPKPVLIHCKAGADRTGMAATLYYYAFRGMPMHQAIQTGLRLRYGHLGEWNTPRIYEVLRQYENNFPQKK